MRVPGARVKLADQLDAAALPVFVTDRVRHEPLSHAESVISDARRVPAGAGVVGVGEAEALAVELALAVAETAGAGLPLGFGVALGLGLGVAVALALGVGLAVGVTTVAVPPFTDSWLGICEPLMHTPVSP